MKVLSVRAPWGYWFFGESLPAGIPVKDIENRTRRTNYRGKVFIHIPATIEMWAYEWLSETFEIPNFCSDNKITPGHIIGSVDLVDCVQNHKSKWSMSAPWHWVLQNPVLLDKPIPCRGQLGIFNFEIPDSVVDNGK